MIEMEKNEIQLIATNLIRDITNKLYLYTLKVTTNIV